MLLLATRYELAPALCLFAIVATVTGIEPVVSSVTGWRFVPIKLYRRIYCDFVLEVTTLRFLLVSSLTNKVPIRFLFNLINKKI